jgi:polyhydroxybutyrate depolymerase
MMSVHIKIVILFLAGTFFVPGCTTDTPGREKPISPQELRPGEHRFTIMVGRRQRSYVVHVPQNFNKKKGWPVVIMFHGGGGSAKSAMWQTGWAQKADHAKFLAVFPEGTRADPSKPARFSVNPQTWNDGSNRKNVGAIKRKVADVDFVAKMIDDLSRRFKVDKRRIYATGFSNGASMAFQVGRRLSRKFAAIAPVAGSDWSMQTMIDRPIPVLYITGTADPLNPFAGGPIRIGSKTYGKKPPVRELIDNWVRLLGCPAGSRVVYEKDDVRGIAYGPCEQGSELVFYTIDKMGHTWPGGKNRLPERLVGKSSNSIRATDVIWRFFQKHPKK